MRVAVIATALAVVALTACGLVDAMQSTPRRMIKLERALALQAQREALAAGSNESSAKGASSTQTVFVNEAEAMKEIPSDIIEANLTQALDQFGHSTDATFPQRYWYSLRHYKPNSDKPTPVYVLDSGETNAESRIPYLDHGILDILAKATNGIGVVLEHRYYGKSFPKRSDLGPGDTWTVDELRWLTTEQSLEDSAQFVKKMRFDGVSDKDKDKLQAPHTPVISYGGSYPGAKSAFLRVLYPDLFWGSLASSAVVAAIEQFPNYYYPIAAGAQQDCTQAIQASIAYIDGVIAPEPQLGHKQTKRDARATKELMSLFGLQDLEDVTDFANVLSQPLGAFQSLVWDASVSSPAFGKFCSTLVGHKSGPVSPSPRSVDGADDHPEARKYPAIVQNYAKYIRDNVVKACTSEKNQTVQDCFGSQDWSEYTNATTIDDVNGISWSFQVCTQWGYFMTAPPMSPRSVAGAYDYAPSGPKLISSLLDLEYNSKVCRKGFPDGKHFKMPSHPDVDSINKIGNFDLAYDRLAFIDGQYDPWRPATVHSETHAYGGARIDTLDRPFKLIENCWHHCDEYGNKTYEPPRVRQIHAEQTEFVQHWLEQWDAEH